MTRHHHHHDDDDDNPVDKNGVLKDGARVRVPLYLMDSTQRAVAANAAHLHDGHGGGIGHRPGHITTNDAAMHAAVDRAYALRDEEDRNAWRIGSGREGAEGSVCTVRNGDFPDYFGAPGHIVDGIATPDALLSEDELRDMRPVRDGLTLDQLEREHQGRMARSYQAYDEELRNAWRTP